MNGKFNRVAASLFFTFAAIICSLALPATTPGQETAPNGYIGLGTCVGVSGAQILSPFSDHYSCLGLGAVPGVPTPYGGLTFKYDDPNTLLIGGGANDSTGRIYQIAVIRNAAGHITGFSGLARQYPTSSSRIGQYNDGGVAFGPQNVLFVTRYPTNQLEQSKPGSVSPNKVSDLTPLGVVSSVGSLAFVPSGFPGAGKMKLASFPSGTWYDIDFSPDGTGTFNINAATQRTSIGDAEGIAFVPPGSPAISPNSVLIAKYVSERIVVAPLDANGDPITANGHDFLTGLAGAEGAVVDPVTGDALFGTFGTANQVIRISGFAIPSSPSPTPTPTPTATPVKCNYRVGVIFADPNWVLPTGIRDQIQADPDVASVQLFNGAVGTPTLSDLQQYDIVTVINSNAFVNAAALGNSLADYVDAGGVVVQCARSFLGGGTALGVSGRWLSGNYNPFNYTTTERPGQFTGSIQDPAHPLMTGLTTLSFSSVQSTTPASGATTLASTLPTGDPLVAYRPVNGGHTTIGIATFLGYSSLNGDWGKLIVNAGRWLHPCRATPSPTPTATATSTPTATPTATATATPTATPVATPAATATATATVTPRATATATPIATATSTPAATPTATPTPDAHLANISTRMRVEAGDNVLIAGFIVQGDESKRIIIRGIGPSLGAFGIADPLQDPILELNENSVGTIATNDNWAENANAAEIMMSNLAPVNPYESTLLLSVAPGSYTAVLRGKGGSTGVGLIEVYDLDGNSPAKVINISTRGFVLTGENVMIGGLIVTGNDSSTLVLRGLGPSLSEFGVPNALADPLLELHDGNGALIQANNNWRDSQEIAVQNTGLAPTNNLESAILISVTPGNYTAVLKGADGGTGNGLVEVYKVAP